MAVTGIKYVFNASQSMATIWNRETNVAALVVEFNGWPVDHRIPWCDSINFYQRHIRVTLKRRRGNVTGPEREYWLWQCWDSDGDFVRLSRDGKYHGHPKSPPAGRIAGASEVGGDRALVIQPNGELWLDLLGVNRDSAEELDLSSNRDQG